MGLQRGGGSKGGDPKGGSPKSGGAEGWEARNFALGESSRGIVATGRGHGPHQLWVWAPWSCEPLWPVGRRGSHKMHEAQGIRDTPFQNISRYDFHILKGSCHTNVALSGGTTMFQEAGSLRQRNQRRGSHSLEDHDCCSFTAEVTRVADQS